MNLNDSERKIKQPKNTITNQYLAEMEQSYRLSEKYLRHFVRSSFRVLEPGVQFVEGWHIDFMCEHLEYVYDGEIQILVIEVPPAHMKSLTATVCFPCWAWQRWPESRWIFSSYSADLSTMHSLKRRRLIKSHWYQSRWSQKYQLVEDQDRKTVFENNHKGYFLSVSTGGSAGGKHGDFIIIDDPINPERGASDPALLESNAHVEYMLTTRRRDPKRSRAVLIMQRVNKNDAVARVCALKELISKQADMKLNFEIISLQAEAERRSKLIFPKSGKDRVREKGDILWPERFDKSQLNVIREQLGSFIYASQYQQNPIPLGGGIVKQSWFRFYSGEPPHILRCGWFWDTAIKTRDMHDWSVGLLLAECEKGYFALDLVRKRLIYPDLKNQIIISYNGSPAQFVMVEDKASGQQVVQELGRDVNFPVMPFEPKGDKMQRLSLVSPLIESGKLFLPLDANWVKNFIDEFIFFPHGAFDDCVDAGVMGLTHFHLGKKSGKFRGSLIGTEAAAPMAGSLGGRPKW